MSNNFVRSERHAGQSHAVLLPDGLIRLYEGLQEPFDHTESVLASELGRPAVGGVSHLEPSVLNATKVVEAEIIHLWDAPQSEWLTLFGVVFLLMCLDAFVSRKLSSGCYKSHLAMLIGWLICGIAYNALYFLRYGAKDGMDWCLGYALEWMLSVDNLFAFQCILRAYRATGRIQEKALFCGVLGTIVTRAMMFLVIGNLMTAIHYIQFVFGMILIYAGVRNLHDDDEENCGDLAIVRLFKRCLGNRFRDSYDLENNQLFVRDEDGRFCATPLVPLIFCVIVSDVIFAVDSVSAKVAQIPNQYTAYSSSVLALLGLRAMFFVIDDLVQYFQLLKYGVCCILVFIGAELMMAGKFQLPEWITLMFIVSVFNFCIVASILKRHIFCADKAETDAPEDSAVTQMDGSGLSSGSPEEGPSVPEKYSSYSKSPITEELRQKLQSRFEAIEGAQRDLLKRTAQLRKDFPISAAADSAAG